MLSQREKKESQRETDRDRERDREKRETERERETDRERETERRGRERDRQTERGKQKKSHPPNTLARAKPDLERNDSTLSPNSYNERKRRLSLHISKKVPRIIS